MDYSLAPIAAQIQFLDTELALIHVPLHLYNYFVQPILDLVLLPNSSPITDSVSSFSSQSWAYSHPFVSISLSTLECSVVLPRLLAQRYFEPVRNSLEPAARELVWISDESYTVIQVDAQGHDSADAAKRVLELTSPLAMNGISIFFITSYFSDYILVPIRHRATVVTAFEARGFRFQHDPTAGAHSLISTPVTLRREFLPGPASPAITLTPPSFNHQPHRAPGTPPPSTLAELQTRTFATLRRRGIRPSADPSIQLVQCAARKHDHHTDDSTDASLAMLRLRLGLVRCFGTSPRPRFLSLTLCAVEPASILLERRFLAYFSSAAGTQPSSLGLNGLGITAEDDDDDEDDYEVIDDADDSVLLGAMQDPLVPIMLDLRELPWESSGIVCGIAGRLVGEGHEGGVRTALADMSYLSTARAGAVVVAKADLSKAMEALEVGKAV